METKYCIAMVNVPRKKIRHTLPLILEEEVNDTPVLFQDLESAVEATKLYKQWHPEVSFEVREYFGKCKYVFEMMEYGTWRISRDKLFSI